MRLHRHLPSEYVSAAYSAGMKLRAFEEPPLTADVVVTAAADVIHDANRDAYVGLPP